MFHFVFKTMLLIGVSCAKEKQFKSKIFDLASKDPTGSPTVNPTETPSFAPTLDPTLSPTTAPSFNPSNSAKTPFLGKIVNQVSFEYVEEHWLNLEDLELDLGLVRLCELQRVEHHFISGIRVRMVSGEDSGIFLDDIMIDDLILTGVQCEAHEKHRSFIAFERDGEGLTEMSGELIIDGVMYEIDGQTGELYLEEEHPFERDDFDRRHLATLAPGQLDLQIRVTMAENLLNHFGSSNRAIMKVMEGFDWGWDALYDLGYKVLISSIEFVNTVPTQNNDGDLLDYVKKNHPPNPQDAHLTFHVGCYGQHIAGMSAKIGGIYDDLSKRYAFHNFCDTGHWAKSGITHELGHMVGLRHVHDFDIERIGQQGRYCYDYSSGKSCCEHNPPNCDCPEDKKTIMSYCRDPKWGQQFASGQHDKAKWQLSNPIISNYATPKPIVNQYHSGLFQSVNGINRLLQEEGLSAGDFYSGTRSVQTCRWECERNPLCNSFTYCTGENNCHLKTLVVLGTEPTKAGGTCTSYYRKEIKRDLALNPNGNLQHSYEELGNGYGFCRDSNGNRKQLGDMNVDSIKECRWLCDSFFGCAGFQYGRNGYNKDCNLYYEAWGTSSNTNTHSACRKKLGKIDHDGYTWKGKGKCRTSVLGGINLLLRSVTVTDEIQCEKECNQDAACRGFTVRKWTTSSSSCLLFWMAHSGYDDDVGLLGGCWAKN